jgi:hypothetical protein
MEIAALATWITAAAGGLYLLSIWLIEYDKEFQAARATRLPPLVLACHVFLAGGGLIVWAGYLIFDTDNLAWVSVVALLIAAALGSTMAARWVAVYRETRTLQLAAAADVAADGQLATSPPSSGSVWERAASTDAGQVATLNPPVDIGPPERNFPLPVVVGHGLFAATTIALVLLTALGVGGS